MKKKLISILLAVCITIPGVPVYAQEEITGTADMQEQPEEDTSAELQDESREMVEEVPEEIQVQGTASGSGTEADYEEEREISVQGLQEDRAVLKAADTLTIDTMINGSLNWKRAGNPMIMTDSFLSKVSSTATDWYALDLGRLGIEDNYSGFLAAADAYVDRKYTANPTTGLDPYTPTEWHRLTVAVLASGGDPTSIGGRDLIADGTYNCMVGTPWLQGINGAVWALIALDSNGYVTPQDARYDREDLLSYLLSHEAQGGGWSLFEGGSQADFDITGMALQALAPYYTAKADVRGAVDRALNLLAASMGPDGDMRSSKSSAVNCEATVQMIVACCSLGVNPEEVKASSGKSLMDGLKKYYNQGTGGFYHDMRDTDAGSDDMSTQQALYGLASYQRFLNGELNLYDFRQPAKSSQYQIQAEGKQYVVPAGAEETLSLPSGAEEIEIQNLPIGSYDSAQISDGEHTYSSSWRRQDGSTPVDGSIPVSDGMVLDLSVNRRDGSTENWKLTIKLEEDADLKAVIDLIDAIPDISGLMLSDETTVQNAKQAYDLLAEEKKPSVTNLNKLQDALKRIEALKAEQESELEEARAKLQKEVDAIPQPVMISQKNKLQQYLLKLDTLGEWSQKAELKKQIQGYLADIGEREAVVAQLDGDIWDRIDPLHITQNEMPTIKELMQRYGNLYEEEQGLLANGKSLLDAADIITSLEEGIIPAQVFRNMMSTKEDFVYSGFFDSGKLYTLRFDAESIRTASDVKAGIEVLSEKDKDVPGSAGAVRFLQQGSMNGKVTLLCPAGIADYTYDLYLMDPGSLEIKSAGQAKVSEGQVSMTVSRGGQYWLADRVISLSGGGEIFPQTMAAPLVLPGLVGEKKSSGSTAGSTASPAASQNSGNTSTTGTETAKKQEIKTQHELIKAQPVNGIIKKSEFEKIKGQDKNLQAEGLLFDGVTYTLTFHGEDIKEPSDFKYEIKGECENSTYIRRLSENPVILCMEETGKFPGKALISVKTGQEDGNYLLFRYDTEKMEAEYVKKVTASEGTIVFTLEEGGEYFIAKRAKSGSLLEDLEVKKAGIGDIGEDSKEAWMEDEELVVSGNAEKKASPFVWAGIGGAVLLCAGGVVFFLNKKRKVRGIHEAEK